MNTQLISTISLRGQSSKYSTAFLIKHTIQSNSVKYLYTEYEYRGHYDVEIESYTNPKLIDWIFSQQLSVDQNQDDYQYKYAFNIYSDKVVAKLGGDSLLFFSDINIPDNNQINVYAIVTNESESYKDSIQLFDDGNIVDSLEGDKLYSNIFLVPDFEDVFNVSISSCFSR